MSRPPRGGLCKPDQFNLYTTVAPEGAEPDPPTPAPLPIFGKQVSHLRSVLTKPVVLSTPGCFGLPPSSPHPQAVRRLKDKPLQRLNVLHPSGLCCLKQGLVRLTQKKKKKKVHGEGR